MNNMMVNEQALRAAIGANTARQASVSALRDRAHTAAKAAYIWRDRHHALRDELVRLVDRLATDPVAPAVKARFLDPISAVLAQHGGPRQGRMVFDKTPPPAKRPLTPTQLVVLGYVAEGYSHEQTAASVHLSVHTVKSHVRKILDSLSVRTCVQAVHVAHQLGLLGNQPLTADPDAEPAGPGGDRA